MVVLQLPAAACWGDRPVARQPAALRGDDLQLSGAQSMMSRRRCDGHIPDTTTVFKQVTLIITTKLLLIQSDLVSPLYSCIENLSSFASVSRAGC
jgi:hypothetical protein